MPDREKVIKWADKCLASGYSEECNECPYQLDHEGLYSCVEGILRDALILLKEQEEEIENLKQTAQSMMEGVCLLKEQEPKMVKIDGNAGCTGGTVPPSC